MIRHLLRLAWNRRGANALVAAEVFLVFLVVAVIATFGFFLLDNYTQPLGFDFRDVWTVRIETNEAGADDAPAGEARPADTAAGQRGRIETLARLVRDLPDVLAVSVATHAPYEAGGASAAITLSGRHCDFGTSEVDDAFADVMRLRLTRGRWFGAEDDGAAWRAAIVNERLARELFGEADPIGRVVRDDQSAGADRPSAPPMKIVGVISDFRRDGELEPPGNYAFFRSASGATAQAGGAARWLLVRVRPGTAADFEGQFAHTLQSGERTWSFRARSLERARSTIMREYLPALTTCAFVASFLVLMVVLGLTGVLWQSVTRRRRELGLRRAVGATAGAITRQILGEVVVLTSFAVAAGLAVAVQLPVLDLLGPIAPGVYAAALTLAVTCIYGLALAGAWAPARLAGRVAPAGALRDE